MSSGLCLGQTEKELLLFPFYWPNTWILSPSLLLPSQSPVRKPLPVFRPTTTVIKDSSNERVGT